MLFLVLLFIVLPIAEIYVIIQVGNAIGVLPTIALLIVDGFVGAALARSQGRAAWARFNQAIAEGRIAIGVDGMAFELDLGALSRGEAPVDPARLSSALTGGRWELARILSASFDDGLLLAVVALRPAGAGGHGEEAVTGILARAGEPAVVDETLLSVEYD